MRPSEPTETSWVFDGSMDAWVDERANAVGFDDIGSSPFADDIIWVAEQGITLGCGPRLFCPADGVTRGQMASFLARALGYPASAADWFTDDDGTTHEANINRLADAAVTLGCEPGLFCPRPTSHGVRWRLFCAGRVMALVCAQLRE